MAPYSSKVTLQAKWHQGWALMHAGKTTEGYDLLSGVRLRDLPCVASPEQPDRIVVRVQAIFDRHPNRKALEDLGVMEALARANKRGDRDATELLVFGDLGELSGRSFSPAGPETAKV